MLAEWNIFSAVNTALIVLGITILMGMFHTILRLKEQMTEMEGRFNGRVTKIVESIHALANPTVVNKPTIHVETQTGTVSPEQPKG